MNSPLPVTAVRHRLILCVDDGEVALRIRKLLLCSEGYKVLGASSGEEALEVFMQNPVELVISDHFLSGKSGTEIAREMKNLKPAVPILIVSAALERPDGLEFTEGFVAKCEGPTVLLDTIALLLAKQR